MIFFHCFYYSLNLLSMSLQTSLSEVPLRNFIDIFLCNWMLWVNMAALWLCLKTALMYKTMNEPESAVWTDWSLEMVYSYNNYLDMSYMQIVFVFSWKGLSFTFFMDSTKEWRTMCFMLKRFIHFPLSATRTNSVQRKTLQEPQKTEELLSNITLKMFFLCVCEGGCLLAFGSVAIRFIV